MNPGLLHFSGLGTDPKGDLCGMRDLLAPLAELLSADLEVIEWNDPDRLGKFSAFCEKHPGVYASGHSHGGDRLRSAIELQLPPNVLVSSYLDDAPPGEPLRWSGVPVPLPREAGYSLCFFQRNDLALAGLHLLADEVYDVSAWGLHHSTMCGDSRVHNAIRAAVLSAHIRVQRAAIRIAENSTNMNLRSPDIRGTGSFQTPPP